LSAVAFHKSIDWADHHLIKNVAKASAPWVWGGLVLLPALGGLAAGFMIRFWVPEAAGSGIPQTKAAYFLKFGRIRFRTAVGKFLLGVISIGSGSSLGREGPTVQISAALASWVGRWLGLAPRLVQRLIPMAAAGGIAAAFNTPLAAIMFAIEEIMGDLKHRALAGIFLVAVIAAVIERGILGSSSLFRVPLHVDFEPSELIWSLLVGILAGVFSHLFVGSLLSLRQRIKRVRGAGAWAMPAVGGLGTGLIGTAVFAPTLFLGAMLGGALATAVDLVPGIPSIQTGSLALIGMGAMFAGVIRSPVTSILIIMELTGDYALILPIMLANLTAYSLAAHWRKIPIYEALLLQDDVNLRQFPILRPHSNWQNLPVNTIMTNDAVSLRANQSLPEAFAEIKGRSFNLFPVLNEKGDFFGMVHRKGIINVVESHPERRVEDVLVSPQIPICHPDQPIWEVVKLFVDCDHTTLPIISRIDPYRLLGVVTLHDITRQQFLNESQGV
jgi:CIC family chloride channel protein